MHSLHLVISKASLIDAEIPPNQPPMLENAVIYLNSETNFISSNDRAIALCPLQVWWSWVQAPWESFSKIATLPEIATRKRA